MIERISQQRQPQGLKQFQDLRTILAVTSTSLIKTAQVIGALSQQRIGKKTPPKAKLKKPNQKQKDSLAAMSDEVVSAIDAINELRNQIAPQIKDTWSLPSDEQADAEVAEESNAEEVDPEVAEEANVDEVDEVDAELASEVDVDADNDSAPTLKP